MSLTINFFNLNLGDPIVNAKFGGMYESFFRAFSSFGCRAIYSHDVPSARAHVLVVPMGGGQDYSSIQAMRRFAGPAVLYVPPAQSWFDKELLSRLCGRVLFAYGTDASTYSFQKYTEIGIPYRYLPFGSDPEVMRPLNLSPQYDVVFVGSRGHAERRKMFLDRLINNLKGKKCLLIGSGWKIYGFPEQLIAWGPLLNIIYNLGKICVNIHTNEQVQDMTKRSDLNNRVFDLAMAGCCQVCDNPEAIRLNFNEDEVVIAKNRDDWVERILYLLAHPEEAESYRIKAFNRALSAHTWQKRASEFLEILRPLIENWRPVMAGDIKPHLGLVFAESKRRLKKAIAGGWSRDPYYSRYKNL